MYSGINIQAVALVSIGLLVVLASLGVIMSFLQKDNATNQVTRFLKEGNYKRALAVSFKLSNLNPNDYSHKFNIGRAYEGLKDYRQAIEYYERASVTAGQGSPDTVKVMILLKIAGLYQAIHKSSEALGYYMMVLEKDPVNLQALSFSGRLLYEMKNFQKSRDYLETLLKIRPDDLQSRFTLAGVYQCLSNNQAAVSQLDRIIKHPKSDRENMVPKVSLQMADLLVQMKNYTRAIEVLKPVMENRTCFESVVERMINIYIKVKNLSLAVDLANRYFNRVSKDKQSVLLYLIATAYFADGEYYRAVKTWEKAYQQNPGYKDLKSIMTNYAYLVHNPKLEPLFSKSEAALETLVLRLLKKTSVKQIVRETNYWAVETRESAFVFYRRPYPIPVSELAEIQRVVTQNFRVNSIFRLYSLYGVSEDTNTLRSRPGSQKIDMFSESQLVELVNSSSL